LKEFYVRVAPKNNAACLSAANIYSNPHENNTFSSEKVCDVQSCLLGYTAV
jgi:hypothetical protein